MYELTLLRHGRSLADDENKCEGRYDSPLTQKGINQAKETAFNFKNENMIFNRILTSPLLRAYQTAEIINEQYKLPLMIEPLLMEHDNGILAGMDFDKLNAKYPLPDFLSPFRYYPEHSGENAVMEHSRAGLALNKIIDNGPGKYLIVSHGRILNAIVRNMFGIIYQTNNSGVSFSFRDNGYMIVQYNENKHHWKLLRFS